MSTIGWIPSCKRNIVLAVRTCVKGGGGKSEMSDCWETKITVTYLNTIFSFVNFRKLRMRVEHADLKIRMLAFKNREEKKMNVDEWEMYEDNKMAESLNGERETFSFSGIRMQEFSRLLQNVAREKEDGWKVAKKETDLLQRFISAKRRRKIARRLTARIGIFSSILRFVES